MTCKYNVSIYGAIDTVARKFLTQPKSNSATAVACSIAPTIPPDSWTIFVREYVRAVSRRMLWHNETSKKWILVVPEASALESAATKRTEVQRRLQEARKQHRRAARNAPSPAVITSTRLRTRREVQEDRRPTPPPPATIIEQEEAAGLSSVEQPESPDMAAITRKIATLFNEEEERLIAILDYATALVTNKNIMKITTWQKFINDRPDIFGNENGGAVRNMATKLARGHGLTEQFVKDHALKLQHLKNVYQKYMCKY